MRRPAQPDTTALEIANTILGTGKKLSEAMQIPALAIAIRARAKKHMRDKQRPDFKKLQSADCE
jgi:hypothetical protein